MKILEDAMHGISSATMRLMSTKSLEAYREECRQEVLNNFNGTYDDIDRDHINWHDAERSLADKELARRSRNRR